MVVRVGDGLCERQSVRGDAEAEAELLRRRFGRFGAADVSDLWAWSGVYVRRLRVILDRLGDELVEVDRGGRPGFLLKKDLRDLEKAAIDGGGVRLLPSFDPFLLGHRNRDHLVDRAHYKRVYKDQGWLAPVVLMDGRVAGTWSYDRGPKKLGVDVTMFSNFDRATRKKVTEEAQDLSRFFEAPEMAIRFH